MQSNQIYFKKIIYTS